MSEWISVEDRTPDISVNGISDPVLAWDGKDQLVAGLEEMINGNPVWFIHFEYETIFGVTHWMPLPEPPQ